MRIVVFVLMLCVGASVSYSAKAEQPIEEKKVSTVKRLTPLERFDTPSLKPLKELFLGISAFDEKRMKAVATDDFQLLEHGEIWSMQKLAHAIMPKRGPYQRTNYFELIRVQEMENSVWVSYWNKAHFESERGSGDVVWLESAVIVKTKDGWKIQMLHSTRLNKEYFPKNINWFKVGPEWPQSLLPAKTEHENHDQKETESKEKSED